MIVIRNIDTPQIVSFYPRKLDVDTIVLMNELSEVEQQIIFSGGTDYNRFIFTATFVLKDYNFYILIAKDAQGNELFRDKLYVLDENGGTGTDNHFEALHEQNNTEQYITL